MLSLLLSLLLALGFITEEADYYELPVEQQENYQEQLVGQYDLII